MLEVIDKTDEMIVFNKPIYKTVRENGYDWLEFSDEAWNNAEFVEWTDGYPWFTRR